MPKYGIIVQGLYTRETDGTKGFSNDALKTFMMPESGEGVTEQWRIKPENVGQCVIDKGGHFIYGVLMKEFESDKRALAQAQSMCELFNKQAVNVEIRLLKFR